MLFSPRENVPSYSIEECEFGKSRPGRSLPRAQQRLRSSRLGNENRTAESMPHRQPRCFTYFFQNIFVYFAV